MSIRTKQNLAMELSKLKGFEKPSFMLEQYATPAHIAADWIWQMAMKGEVAGKIILDAASGPGIIGIGLLLLGARKVFFVDKDIDAMNLCIQNYNVLKDEYEVGEAEFIIEDVSLFDEHVDIVVQNPPFGTKETHIDKVFLEKAFSVAHVVYSMHKYSTQKFVEAIAKDYNFMITDVWRYDFPLKAAFAFHTKPMKNVDVGLWRMEKR
ncbi:DNA methylase [Candidatus Woesearchaeota archaeon CG10_big_fil_rev_8_21_14_0_10_36_11]|nr:MAG: DNA methylase [Candidatus Woesearchaeota archaeon CG10_big_fil_rev_8_21_14_0_10_36_11]